MELELTREGSISGICTTGYLQCGAFNFASVEQDWEDNKRFVSCIPLGRYKLVPYSSPKYPDHYALVNEELGVYKDKEDIPEGVEDARYAILIHVANIASQLQGCIAIGMARAYVQPRKHKKELGVKSSTPAFNTMMSLLDNDEEHHITIKEAKLSW